MSDTCRTGVQCASASHLCRRTHHQLGVSVLHRFWDSNMQNFNVYGSGETEITKKGGKSKYFARAGSVNTEKALFSS